MSRRDETRMSPEELVRYVTERTVITLATLGPNGRPHLTPLWYVPRDLDPDADPPLRLTTWTYGKSQKAVNLRRDPRATLLIESGDSYDQLRGVSMECDVELVTDTDAVAAIGLDLARRYTPEGEVDALRQAVTAQAPKRVGLVCTPTKIVSWDHTKLGAGY
ncbi:pyridoxamine 5'-phosphate oxidase family protein [Saccharomonospora viridis]|jgi:PPOX class probable F420-dependent enzyme|uniref:Pyridoxamine 5'-phosphate oxidase n=1 Tax=Saccharomonospora viridis (strain ATCC 15386 / DSM 43017 / JCM 3036 / CCUG 5913 / NBRC 12207 / NCIMB 9602 / P101) TaxID=471857 RepID=C7MRI5_SACVD|nr:pyridoxamine 5'-phosphate oxidase family protein [Saccharomonospora viridis]ACU98771.1 Pyridoxamine 5'-phosphate oxidase [Saccharomonospora viridis DSM 43017]